jgi:hypothetical protein
LTLYAPRLQTCKKLSFNAEFYSVKRRHSSVPTPPRNVQQRDIGENCLKLMSLQPISYRGAGSSHGADASKAAGSGSVHPGWLLNSKVSFQKDFQKYKNSRRNDII